MFHRSDFIEAQRCMRRRYWGSIYNGTGIEPARLSIPLHVGSSVHKGLAELMRGHSVELAVHQACGYFEEALSKAGFDAGAFTDDDYLRVEQSSLVEALVRMAAFRITPKLLERYNVLAVEESLEDEIAPGIVLAGIPDAVLQEKETGNVYDLNWKTKARWDGRAFEDAQHDDQGLSESYLIHKCENLVVDGVIMIWLFKGERREYPAGSGQWTQSSPLIRGYRKFDKDGTAQWAWKWEWEENGEGHRLDKGWQKANMWEQAGGVKAWIDKLNGGEIQPEAGDCLGQQAYWPASFYRNDQEIEEWLRDAAYVESLCSARDTPTWSAVRYYPKSRHSCSYPSRCPFYQICWGPPHIAEAPLENGYVLRRPR